MSKHAARSQTRIQCAIYTRKSSEEGLEQSFNSLDAQREACEAYIKSQRHEGWVPNPTHYDDGGFSGGTMQRPALTQLIEDIKQGAVDIIVVYKVDRLSRSLADFVQIIELFDQQEVSFVSVTQQFNTSSSMGRLTLNVLLSFAQFEREVTGERIRDKIAASKKKGMWMGGVVPLGYDAEDRSLVANKSEAKTVQHIYARYLALRCVRKLKQELDTSGYVSKVRQTQGQPSGGKSFSRGALYTLLKNPLYIGKVAHKKQLHDGQHTAIVAPDTWDQVQALLSKNRQRKALRTLAKDPGILAGYLFDDRNNPMSSSHTTKKNRRYRYYVSQAVLQYREQEAGTVTRVPATSLEEIVTSRFKTLLSKGHDLTKAVSSRQLSAHHQQAMVTRGKALSNEWSTLSPARQIASLKKCINRITVGSSEVTVSFSVDGLLSTLLDNVGWTAVSDHASTDEFVVVIAVKLKRCGRETRLIIPNDDQSEANHATIQAIQSALAKALAWNQALVCGAVSSMTELAETNHVTQRYIAHLIKLAYLAPDIQDAINRSLIPLELTLDRLKNGFPLDWTEQHEALGFRSRLLCRPVEPAQSD